MSLTYNQYSTELAALCQFNAADPFFTTNLPSTLDYAQDRISRELNLLNTVVSNTTLALTSGSRKLDITSATMNVMQDINLVTPAGTTNPELGSRNPLTIASKEFLDWTYGSSVGSAIPNYFAMLTDTEILFGPWPDQNYTVELIGSTRPLGLSNTNQTTWVSTYLPDLLLAASMVFMAGAMKNFGAQADDPKMAVSWESQYTTLRDSANVEDLRRKFQSQGWTSELPSPLTPPRV